jgi:N-acetylglucosamine-6-phosphate deacetylase
MSNLAIIQGRLPAEFVAVQVADSDGFAAAHVHTEGEVITAVTTGEAASVSASLDATGCYVLPGFVDVHVHGGHGHDTMDADPDALAAMARFFARHGVTGFLPTTMTAPLDPIEAAVRTVAGAPVRPADGARMLGVHLEGPYISPEFPGAQRKEDIRPPSVAEFARLAAAGPVRMMTLAPEQPGGAALVSAVIGSGSVAVVGHSSATYDESITAFDLGVNQATHTYNAMTGLHHRRPGTLGAVLSDDRVFAQLIADNIHVHPAAMNVLARCKGPTRTVLITDAMRAAGLPEGDYELGGQPVSVRDGQCRLADGTLAGSVLTMDRALVNFMAAAGWSLAQAWPATSRTPATSIGLHDRLGAIRPGYLADLVLLNQELGVEATIVAGQIAYLRDPARLH